MTDQFFLPRLYDIPIPDLFTLLAEQNPDRYIAQILQELDNNDIHCTAIKWATFIQHAQNVAADLRSRWAQNLKDDDSWTKVAYPRRPGDELVVVAILATTGYQYYVNLIGCTLNRWTVLLISPKNSLPGIEHLLRVSRATLLLLDSSSADIGEALKYSILHLSIQTLSTIDEPSNGPAKSPLTPLTSAEVEAELGLPVLYMHTSGSTGHPKIIPWTHHFVLSGSRTRRRDGNEYIGVPLYCVPPLSHAMGIFAYVMYVCAHANIITFVSSPTPKPPSSSSLLKYLPFIKGAIVAVPPSILEDLCDLGLEAVNSVARATTTVIFAGAPLKIATGNILVSAGMKLVTAYGSTELNMGTKARPRPRPEDWEYVEFCEGYDWHFVPVDDDPYLRELIAAPGPEDSPAVFNHDDPLGYATNDVWSPHPFSPNLWKHHSRKGDITVLSNGEKTDNRQVESLLLEDRNIVQVQVFGGGRPLNGVILKPADSSISVQAFLLMIEPTIRRTNSILPKHSHILPELIIVAPPDKPFRMTDKNTIKRKETLDAFENEIEACYAMLEQGMICDNVVFEGNVNDVSDVKAFVRFAVKEVLNHDIPDEEDLFEHGLDSLLSIRVRAALASVVKRTLTASQPLPRNVTYICPSINSLTEYLLSRAAPQPSNLVEDTHNEIHRIISKYSRDFPTYTPGMDTVSGEMVALTGSTGSLGSCLLMILLQRQSVSRIYLLSRRGSGTQKERQVKALRDRGFDPAVLDDNKDRVFYMQVDLSKHELGLSQTEYAELRDNVTHVIHSAWEVNFNLVLKSYERVHVAGVRHLIDLALASPQSQTPRLIFLSSIAAAGSYKGQILIPEEPISESSVPLAHGYGQSKYISERILVAASEIGLRTTIIRIGQLSGISENGIWTRSEHVPILFSSSMALGMIPYDLAPTRWLPVDTAASAIIKQTFAPSMTLQYFHIENTSFTPWKDIAEAASRASPIPLNLVTFSEWLEYIRKSAPAPEKVPAVRLFDFYLDLARAGPICALDLQSSVQVSSELAFGPILPELVKKYIIYQAQYDSQ